MNKDNISKALEDQKILMKALQQEMTGVKLLIDTVGALIDTLAEKGIITKKEISKRLKNNSGASKKTKKKS